MPATMSGAPVIAGAFSHPALFYRGRDEYLAATVPFVRDGLAGDEPVAVAVPGDNLTALRAALGAQAGAVRFLDMTRAGRNPGRIIPAVLRDFTDAHAGRRVRIIGEPIWPGRSELEYPACAQHEALINPAFAGRAATILCPYDADGLAEAVLVDAAATHPVLMDVGGSVNSLDYHPERIVAAYNQPLVPAPVDAAAFDFDLDGLAAVRHFVLDQADRRRLATNRLDDLELAAGELISNTILHGGGAGTARVWTTGDHLACEVSDAGHIADPLAGRLPVGVDDESGRGLLLVNLVADLVRVHTAPAGTTVRVYLRL